MKDFSRLSKHFLAIGAKKITEVEINPKKSNQHEFAAGHFRKFLGDEKRIFESDFIYLCDEPQKNNSDSASLTYYDSRAGKPERSAEYRFYYSANSVIEHAKAGDLLVVAIKPNDEALIIIAEANSTAESQMAHLFDLALDQSGRSFSTRVLDPESGTLDISTAFLLEQLGEEIVSPDDSYLELLLQRFPDGLPDTRTFSALARETLSNLSALDSVDLAVVRWFEQEEILFRTYEKHIVEKRLAAGFQEVDDFVKFSLSVHNRRKSRAGYAFENHLEAAFKELGIPYSRGQLTEGKSKPDFIFPGIEEYRDETFPATRLAMLGVKTTCKDRWRQVLPEANRIEAKHLATLEPSISRAQTAEMQQLSVILVVPEEIQKSYDHRQQRQLLSLQSFCELVQH